MKIEYDPAKRAKTLRERGLDFEDAREVFAGEHITKEDTRKDYGEPRFATAGLLRGNAVTVVWTPREDALRIISMRRMHDEEFRRFSAHAV